MATQILADPISQFMVQYPKMVINVSVNDKQTDIINDNIDIAIRASQLDDSGYKARFLFNNKAVYLASPAFLNKSGVISHPRDLAGKSLLAYSLSQNSTKKTFTKRGCDPIKVDMEITFKSDSPELLLKMALAGHGITQLPTWMIDDSIQSGLLSTLLTEYDNVNLPMYAVFKANKYEPKRIRAFVEHMVKYFEGSW